MKKVADLVWGGVEKQVYSRIKYEAPIINFIEWRILCRKLVDIINKTQETIL